MRKRTEPSEPNKGVGELLAFVLVAGVSACAFFAVGSNRPPPVARVVSMAQTSDDRTSSVPAPLREMRLSEVPVPTPRPY